ncbi:MAG: hypothetical protein ACXADB_09670 [Candidatus Hermodarchaeia archaeon]|jgi:hypothetical protein
MKKPIHLKRENIVQSLSVHGPNEEVFKISEQQRERLLKLDEVVDCFEDTVLVRFHGLRDFQNLGKVEAKVLQILGN